MDYNNNNRKQKSELPKPIGCLIALIVLWILFLIWWFFLSMWIEMYKDAPFRWKIIFRIFILLAVCYIVLKIIRISHLHKAVESWTAIRKKAKVIDFSYGYNGWGGEDDTSNWYYVVVSDWIDDYDWMFHRWARIIWKLDEDLKKDEFYKENGITLDLNNRDITRKQLDQKISEIELQMSDVWFFKKWKLKVKIWELKNKKNDLEPYHLHTREWDFYIWDEYTILIDPDDPSNYTFERDWV